MKKYISFIVALFTMSFVLMACSDDHEQHEVGNHAEDSYTEDKQNPEDDNSEEDNDSSATKTSEGTDNNDSDNQAEREGNGLSDYSSEQIEYARVWLELGENQDIDKLYAEEIPAGEILNPDDKTSADYPEDVVQLSGTRLVDGTVTYSSNGDGTIQVYDVPKRWDGKNPAGEGVYQDIIDDTEQASIDRGDDESVKELIKKLEIK